MGKRKDQFVAVDCLNCAWNNRHLPEDSDKSGFCLKWKEQPRIACAERVDVSKFPSGTFNIRRIGRHDQIVRLSAQRVDLREIASGTILPVHPARVQR